MGRAELHCRFAAVLKECRRKRYRLALSNPCIELWLLLHFGDYSPSAQPLSGKAASDHVVGQLRSAAGGYSKANCDRLPITVAGIQDAVRRAEELDVTDEELPTHPMTRMHKIVQELQRRELITLADL